LPASSKSSSPAFTKLFLPPLLSCRENQPSVVMDQSWWAGRVCPQRGVAGTKTLECGGKRRQAKRDAAFAAISELLKPIESGVALRLPPHSIK